MTIEAICDGCGKRQAVKSWHKPHEWFSREDEDGAQLACSRECIAAVARASGKTGLVLPI